MTAKSWVEIESKVVELERENVELTQSLERACEWIMHTVRGNCEGCPLKNNCPGGNYGLNCLETLKKHFKEAAQ